MKKFLLSLFGVIAAFPIFAREFSYTYEGKTLSYTVLDEDAKTCEVSGRNNVAGELILPENPTDGENVYTLISIGDYAIYSCFDLSAVTIPNTVTKIGQAAFWGCIGLTSLTIPNSVQEIGQAAFSNCSRLTSVEISNSVERIGNNAFSRCSGLTEITLPASVTELGNSLFSNCVGLKEINVDAENKNYASIDGVLFDKEIKTLLQYPAGKEDDVYSIPNTVASIAYEAFANCNALTSVIIPDSVMEIGEAAFCDCRNLMSVTIPNSVITIGSSAFFSCISLTSLEIGNSVNGIGNGAFMNCLALPMVNIPNGTTYIGFNSFANCGALTSVIIPGSVTEIGSGAFSYCAELKEINVVADNENFVSVDGVLYDKDMTTILQYPAGKAEIEYSLPATVSTVYAAAFFGVSAIEKLRVYNRQNQKYIFAKRKVQFSEFSRDCLKAV